MKNIKHSTFYALRRFLALWISQNVSAIGTAMTTYALTVWTYEQNGTASSVALLTLSSFLPTILFRFAAGALVDRWNKKAIMLWADLTAAAGSLLILLLFQADRLTAVHLYWINLVMSLTNAFQVPAAYVATSQLVPKEHYSRASGLQAVSGAAISILAPALGGALTAFGGLSVVLMIDLLTFAAAWMTLLLLSLPEPEHSMQTASDSFWQNVLAGIRYLQNQPKLFGLILYIALVNFLAKLGPDGQMSAFVLSRANQPALGAVQTSIALGLMCGGAIMTARKPSSRPDQAIPLFCLCIFVFTIPLSLCKTAIGWCVFAFLQYLCAAVMNVHWDTFMRSQVPLPLQARVYSARDTLQNSAIPLGLYLGGVLADQVFEPLMQSKHWLSGLLHPVFGTGEGSGIALLFFLTATVGVMVSLWRMLKE